MNVIFLDIDGVMNSQLFYRTRRRKRWLKLNTYTWWIIAKIKFALNGFKPVYYSLADYKTPESHTKFDYLFGRIIEETDKEKWKWLSEFCNSTDTKICISSVWKHHFHGNPETNLQWWNDALLLLGFKQGTFVGITPSRETLRGTEIQNWINENPVEKYAIIDDDSDMLPEQLSNFFLSDGYVGLTPTMIYRIDRHFKGLNELVFIKHPTPVYSPTNFKRAKKNFILTNIVLCKAAFDKFIGYEYSKTKEGVLLVEKARKELGYSNKTGSQDIYHGIWVEYQILKKNDFIIYETNPIK